jgi:dolichyl-phosphate-mannose-protein mannosyltransferase
VPGAAATDAAAIASPDKPDVLAYDRAVQRVRTFVRRPVVAVIAVGILAAAVRFYHLGTPPAHVFDEAYYPKAGCLFVGYPRRECDVTSSDEKYWADRYNDVGSWVHPPLGKWAIGAGELAFGPDAFGWRFSAAVAGTLSVMVLAAIAQVLFGEVVWTYVAGVLLATEHLNVVQSRIGMLDIFLALWVVVAFLLLLLDRRWIERRTSTALRDEPSLVAAEARGSRAQAAETIEASAAGRRAESATLVAAPPEEHRARVGVPSPVLRPWRVAAGVALGAAIATKWSGATAIAFAVILSLLWERTRRRNAGVAHPVARALVQETLGVAISFLLVPAAVYVASWAGYFAWFGFDLGAWARMQAAMFSYHEHLKTLNDKGKPIHPYLSRAWQWIVMARPVVYFYEEHAGLRREIIGMGNPVTLWASVVAIPYLAVAWRRSRDWVAGAILVAIVVQYLPWFAVPRPQFFFYFTPVTPFLVLAVVYGLRRLARVRVEPGENDDAVRAARPWLPVVVGVVGLSVAAFVWFWPVLTAGSLTTHAWSLRIWFNGDPWPAFNWV